MRKEIDGVATLAQDGYGFAMLDKRLIKQYF